MRPSFLIGRSFSCAYQGSALQVDTDVHVSSVREGFVEGGRSSRTHGHVAQRAEGLSMSDLSTRVCVQTPDGEAREECAPWWNGNTRFRMIETMKESGSCLVAMRYLSETRWFVICDDCSFCLMIR